eukprot:1149406-Pelagomonas_calceolata.AAC.1
MLRSLDQPWSAIHAILRCLGILVNHNTHQRSTVYVYQRDGNAPCTNCHLAWTVFFFYARGTLWALVGLGTLPNTAARCQFGLWSLWDAVSSEFASTPSTLSTP